MRSGAIRWEDVVKNYLNQRERELVGLGLVILEELKSFQGSKEERAALRTATGFYNTFFKRLMGRLGTDIGHRIIRDFKGCTVSYKPIGVRPKVVYEFDEEGMAELSAAAMMHACLGCPGKQECALRDIFLQTGVPVCNEEDAECPYRVVTHNA